MRAIPYAVVTSLAVAALSGCSGTLALPDRTNPVVKAEETRLATLLGADPTVIGGPAICKVRLLGMQQGASFVWAQCEGSEPPHSGVSAPARIAGTTVTWPEDGEGYASSLRKVFPTDLAEYVIEQDALSLRP